MCFLGIGLRLFFSWLFIWVLVRMLVIFFMVSWVLIFLMCVVRLVGNVLVMIGRIWLYIRVKGVRLGEIIFK